MLTPSISVSEMDDSSSVDIFTITPLTTRAPIKGPQKVLYINKD